MVSGQIFEQEVYNALHQLLGPNEYLFSYNEVGDLQGRINCDFILLEGCRALELPEKSVVEVKLRISTNTVGILMKNYDRLMSLNDNYTYVVIIGEDNYNLKLLRARFLELPNFKLISYRWIKNCIDRLREKKKNVNKNAELTQNSKDEDLNIASGDKSPSASETLAGKDSKSNILEKLKEYLIECRCSLVLGAGVSMDANVPSWGELLTELIMYNKKYSKSDAEEYFQKLLKDNNHSYLIAARIILKDMNEDEQIEEMRKILYRHTKDSQLIRTICGIIKSRDIDSVITFNYDILLEEHLQGFKRKPVSIAQKDIQHKDSIPVYHVHGIIPRSVKDNGIKNSLSYISPVLSEADYHGLYGDTYNWSNILTLNTLNHSICILIGLSMTDPNLRRLLDISNKNKGEDKSHFVFLGRDKSNDDDYYNIKERLLNELGLKVIWYEIKNNGKDHSELIELLKYLQ